MSKRKTRNGERKRRVKGNTERTIRDMRDHVSGLMAHQQRIGGVEVRRRTDDHPALRANAVPDTNAIRDYLDPIVNRVARDLEDEIENGVRVPTAPEVEVDRPKHSVPTRDDGVMSTMEHSYAGTYDWDLGNDRVRTRRGSWRPKKTKRPNVREIALRHRVKFLKGLCDWRKKMEDTFLSGLAPKAKEAALMAIIEDSCRLFGDWRVPRTPTVSIFAKR